MYFLRRNIAVANGKELTNIADNILYVLHNGLMEKKEPETARKTERERERRT
jgi:hypothetical protein